MTPSLLKRLRSVDTTTVCNAIEVAEGKRGFGDFTRGTMLCSAPLEPPMVGYARTAKIAAIHPPDEPADVIKERRMAYYRHMSEGPDPSVAVIEDMDYPESVGAYWGEINTTVHKGLGLTGALTNGVMRDLGDLPDGFPVIAGSVGPSHAFVHVKEIGTPVIVFGLSISDGDLIHADRHGAVKIPADVVPLLEDAISKLLETEKIVLEAAKADGFDFPAFEEAWARFEKART
ncbi:MAG: RraA family protein [Hyphomicrobiales bacterium]|nr:RraA family protein [Hyphomicrobiales bacterium]MCP4997376.1 RraA family protein [Hyphomicrobiales bacterium]